MRTKDYFQSLTTEVNALKDRVRYLIEEHHWQTDGEWKESVIRQVLRRHLPRSVDIGRGFVVCANGGSHQCDVLVLDSNKPVLFRDGDLAFVTPDAVLGVIEVKSRATPSVVGEVARKMGADMSLIRNHPNTRAFAAMFAFEDRGGDSDDYLAAVAAGAGQWESRLDFVCVGASRFIRYWHLDPENKKQFYEGWHSYRLPRLAPGYFIHNVVDSVSPESVFRNSEMWFPKGGKEPFRDGTLQSSWSHLAPSYPGHNWRV